MAAAATAAAVASSCAERRLEEAAPALPPATGPVVKFEYQAIDGRPLTSQSLVNRVSVIAFFTSYDMACQIEARFLTTLERRHTPRINVAVLMLEAPENLPMVSAFVDSLRLPFPVAFADAATIAGEGPFAGLHHVPSVVVLDRSGREAWRHVGVLNEAALEAAVRAVEAASPPAGPENVAGQDGGLPRALGGAGG